MNSMPSGAGADCLIHVTAGDSWRQWQQLRVGLADERLQEEATTSEQLTAPTKAVLGPGSDQMGEPEIAICHDERLTDRSDGPI